MKKRLLAACIFSVISASAMADNTGAIDFIGTVSAGTCNVSLAAGSGVSGSLITLGTAGVGKSAPPINFILQSDKDCGAGVGGGPGGGPGAMTQVGINLSGNFDEAGLKPVSGTATNARVKLTALNTVAPNTEITKSNAQTVFNLIDFNKDGAKFTATLVGGNTPGDYRSNLTYSVYYK